MALKIPVEIVFDDINSVIDELGKLQKYKLGEGDDMTLVDVDDVDDVLARHVKAREAKESYGTKEGWISCNERLPERGEMVLTINKDDEYEVNHIIDEDDGEWFYDGAIAWMPIPKHYEAERKE